MPLLLLTLSQGDVMQAGQKNKTKTGAAEPDTARLGEPAASQLIKTPPGFLLSVCLSPVSMCSAHLRASHHFTAWFSGVPRNLSA